MSLTGKSMSIALCPVRDGQLIDLLMQTLSHCPPGAENAAGLRSARPTQKFCGDSCELVSDLYMSSSKYFLLMLLYSFA